jgi:methionyl-tRNA formyltransferase
MRIVFMGSPAAATRSLERCVTDGHEVVAVWTQPDKPAGRGEQLRAQPVKDTALRYGLHVEQPRKIKTVEAKELFASYDADVAVVVAYGRILPPEYLAAPRRGCINVHFSLLPLYRGAAPANWAVVNGDVKTGVTTMFIEAELDSGPILLQRETQIGASETATELLSRLATIGADLLSETLAGLDDLTPRPQHHGNATLAPLLQKLDGRIAWERDALAIDRCVRGFQPWPTAYTQYGGQQLTIWKAEPVAVPSRVLTDLDVRDQVSAAGLLPGQVIGARGDELVVKCGADSALRLLEVQLQSKRRMSARDFINGARLKIGDQFGEV